jgi:hypothetical protein
MTAAFVAQDISNLLKKNSDYVLSEVTLRALICTFNMLRQIQIRLVPFSELVKSCEDIRASLRAGEKIRTQLIVQMPITAGVHYAVVDAEFSLSFSRCFLIDASVNEESIHRLKSQLESSFNQVDCVVGDEEIEKLQVDYSSCPLFSLYHALICNEKEDLYEVLDEILRKEERISWMALPVEFILPIQSIKKATKYAEYHESVSTSEYAQIILESIDLHAVVRADNGYKQNRFIFSFMEACRIQFHKVESAHVASFIDGVWTGDKYKYHNILSGKLLSSSIKLTDFASPDEIFVFLNCGPKKLKKASQSPVFSDPRVLIDARTYGIPFFEVLCASNIATTLSNPFIMLGLSSSAITYDQALKVSPKRLLQLEGEHVDSEIERFGLATVLHYSDERLAALLAGRASPCMISKRDRSRSTPCSVSSVEYSDTSAGDVDDDVISSLGLEFLFAMPDDPV